MAIHIGSWGLPEFGVSEAIQRLIAPNKAYASSGGSNLIGSSPAQQIQGAASYNPLADVNRAAPNVGNYSASSNSPAPSGGGNNGGSVGGGGDSRLQQLSQTNRNPVQESEYQALMQQIPQQPQINFDALIAPAIQGLEAAIGPLQEGYQGTVTGIQTNLANQKAATQANISGQEATLNQAKTTQQQGGENAVDEARRQYAEIQQGLQSRYGGTTGTGAFAGELAGRQTMQNIGKVRQAVSSAMLEIDNKLVQVQEVGRIALQDLEDKSADQIRQAKNQLDMQLAEIRRQKGEIQANKAALAANAIQLYQTTVNNVNAQNAQFKQNLYLQQQAAEQNLKLAQQTAQGVVQSYQPTDFTGGTQTTPVGTANTQVNEAGVTAGGSLYDLLRKNYDSGIYSNPWGGY